MGRGDMRDAVRVMSERSERNLVVGELGIGINSGHITRTAEANLHRELLFTGFAHGLDHLQD